MFTGFPEDTLRFFLDLRFHNSIGYFEEHREDFRRDVQEPFYEFINDLAPRMQKIDPQMEIRPYKCLARIRRDTRFTKDKSPFRDHLWLLFRRAAEPREQSLNFWFELGPDGVGWGMGFWGENRPVMDMLRRQMAAQPERILDVIDSCNLPEHRLALGGSSFKRMAVPPQLPERLKPWYLAKELFIPRVAPEMKWVYDEKLIGRVGRDFETMAPLYRLLRGLCDQAQAENGDNTPDGR